MDFNFAYGYDREELKADRLYRYIGGQFERWDFSTDKWVPAPEQICIFIGDDVFYDELTDDEVQALITA